MNIKPIQLLTTNKNNYISLFYYISYMTIIRESVKKEDSTSGAERRQARKGSTQEWKSF